MWRMDIPLGGAKMSPFTHETQQRILYAHTDKAGVVYYAQYLVFFEMGRTEYFRSLGKSYADFEKAGSILTVVDLSCKYHKSAIYDDLITIRTRITRLRRTRIDFAYDVIGPKGELLCEGTTVMGCLDAETYRPRALPDEMVRLLDGKVENAADRPQC
jgi:acyl-CoA thioester hydrolase